MMFKNECCGAHLLEEARGVGGVALRVVGHVLLVHARQRLQHALHGGLRVALGLGARGGEEIKSELECEGLSDIDRPSDYPSD